MSDPIKLPLAVATAAAAALLPAGMIEAGAYLLALVARGVRRQPDPCCC